MCLRELGENVSRNFDGTPGAEWGNENEVERHKKAFAKIRPNGLATRALRNLMVLWTHDPLPICLVEAINKF